MHGGIKQGFHTHLTKPALAPKGNSGYRKHGSIEGVCEIQHGPKSNEMS